MCVHYATLSRSATWRSTASGCGDLLKPQEQREPARCESTPCWGRTWRTCPSWRSPPTRTSLTSWTLATRPGEPGDRVTKLGYSSGGRSWSCVRAMCLSYMVYHAHPPQYGPCVCVCVVLLQALGMSLEYNIVCIVLVVFLTQKWGVCHNGLYCSGSKNLPLAFGGLQRCVCVCVCVCAQAYSVCVCVCVCVCAQAYSVSVCVSLSRVRWGWGRGGVNHALISMRWLRRLISRTHCVNPHISLVAMPQVRLVHSRCVCAYRVIPSILNDSPRTTSNAIGMEPSGGFK